jgi:transcriptional regulator with XRE-family HTH domain
MYCPRMTKAADAAKDATLVHFGSEVRLRRERAGKRRVELADELGISFRHLQRIEIGESRASNAVYWRIADALELDPSAVVREQAAS